MIEPFGPASYCASSKVRGSSTVCRQRHQRQGQDPLDISGDGVDAAMATLVARVGLAGTSRAPKACVLRAAAEIERPCTRGVTPFEQRDREQFDSGVSLAEPVRNSVNVEPRVAPFHVALPGTVEAVKAKTYLVTTADLTALIARGDAIKVGGQTKVIFMTPLVPSVTNKPRPFAE